MKRIPIFFTIMKILHFNTLTVIMRIYFSTYYNEKILQTDQTHPYIDCSYIRSSHHIDTKYENLQAHISMLILKITDSFNWC